MCFGGGQQPAAPINKPDHPVGEAYKGVKETIHTPVMADPTTTSDPSSRDPNDVRTQRDSGANYPRM